MTSSQLATTIRMPSLGESVEEGTITRWLKDPGDRVEAEEPLLEVATDKVDVEIPSPVAGILLDLLVAEDDIVSVGAELATVAAGDDVSDGGAAAGTGAGFTQPPAIRDAAEPTSSDDHHHPVAAASSSITPTVAQTDSRSTNQTSAPASEPTTAATTPEQPSARSAVAPPEADTATATPATATASDSATVTDAVVEKLPRIRRTIAARMVESLQTSAQLTTVLEVDVTEIARLRRAHKDEFLSRSGVKLSFFPFFAKAAVAALAEHRVLNASVNPDVTEITYHGACHLGIAVDSAKGLMVPVIRDAQDLSIEGLARAIADKAERVRAGSITPSELGGGTFTLTNTGSRGALFDTPIINQPQTGILGIGAVVERVVPSRREDNLNIEVRSMAYLSISYDHRVVDGADAARFLTAVKQRLEGGFRATDLQ